MDKKPKFTTLSYLESERKFEPEPWLAGEWDEDWYCDITQMPLAEMLGNTVIGLAEDWLKLTKAQEWVQQYRRSLVPGDIFWIADVPWLFILQEHATKFKAAGMRIERLRAWPAAAIVELTHRKLAEA